MIKKFDTYNESLRDKMTPKSADDIKMGLLNTSLGEKLELIERHKFDHTQTYNKFFKKYFTEDVLRKDAEKESADTKLNLGYCYDIPWLIELGLSEGGNCTSVEGVMRKSCLRGYHKIVKMLLDRGVPADSDNALSCAVEKGHIEIVKMLLEAGANPHEKNNYPFSCSSCSYVQNSLDIFDLLTKYATEDINRYRKCIDIRKAREKANESLRDKMTPKSDDDIRRDLKKLSPKKKLSMGIHNELPWLVEDALKNGADPNMTFPKSSYPIGFSCLMKVIITNCNFDIIKILVKYGANVNAKTKNGSTVLGIVGNLVQYYKREGYDNTKYQMTYDFIKDQLDKTNESVRDLMTPKSDDEIRSIIKKTIGIDSDYIEVKIPEPKEIKKVRSLLKLSDEYNINLKDNKDGNLLACGYITSVFDFIRFYVDYTQINKRNSREFYIDYIIRNISGKITESVRDKMTPKPKEEVEIAKYDIIQSIKRVVDANGGHITMSKIGVSKDDSPVYNETKTEDGIPIRHIITLLYKDDVKVAPYDNNTVRFLTLDWYRVEYEDLSPEIIMEIKSLLEEAVMWGNIYG